MRWPSDLPDPIRRRILGLWSAANGATSVHERAKAALGQLQRNHELSDVALNFIAESELQQPSRDVPKNIPNIVVLIFELIRLVGIVTSLEIALTSAFWLLHTYIFHSARAVVAAEYVPQHAAARVRAGGQDQPTTGRRQAGLNCVQGPDGPDTQSIFAGYR